MARLQEEILVVKVSKLVKDNEHALDIVDDGMLLSLEAVVQELVGKDILVEIAA